MKENKKHIGDLVVKPGVVYNFEEIGGFIDASGADTKTAFPKLTTVGGTIYARGADTKTAFPKLTSVGGTIDARGADTKTAFPKLTTVGGSIYASGADTKTAKQNDPDAAQRCARDLERSFNSNGFTFKDNILAAIVRKRGNVCVVRIVGQTKDSWLVNDGDRYAHGATLAQARESLKYKIGSRDTTEYKSWTLDTKTKADVMIRAYRVIAGACEAGVKQFLSTRTVPAKLSVREAIEITNGAFGNDVFARFFAK